MRTRLFWKEKIEAAWRYRPIVWLSGIRRIGKTTLCKQLEPITYFNCDLPSVVRQLENPELFFASHPADVRIVLDEIHRLKDPSLVLKIAADAFPRLKILATGSSSLAATKKFTDSLTGRKVSIYLPPVLWPECTADFSVIDFDKRLLFGGFPSVLLSDSRDDYFYEEWIESFYARDVTELFGLRNRSGFLKMLHLLLLKNGSQFDASQLAQESGLSRQTIVSYLAACEVAHAAFILRPFYGGGSREIVRQPKIYGVDTGLISYVRGWDTLRDDEKGGLWENLVLDVLLATFSPTSLHYWRTKSQDEIDFVIERGRGVIDIVEAKMNPDKVRLSSIAKFRQSYPQGDNYVVSPFVEKGYTIYSNSVSIRISGLSEILLAKIS